MRGTFDHQCLVLRAPDGDIRAFVSLRQLSEREARIGLLAGRGAGAELMQAAQRWAALRELTTLRVATQMGNTAALKRYILSGANVEAPRTGYTGDMMIPFNAPPVVGTELDYMQSAMGSGKLCGDGGFTAAASSGWSSVLAPRKRC
ncbi:lipopolysaccharide biosynthesis protein RffC [Klebsiella michiganensis]|uniref:Lipopolysaccharide biosynthesis protein RffC n=1 Tax=Klebsiella michiganensis TaxID=1134687 RepID=A0A7H4M2L4_9ENTR|nr:lipopolysaccharide biosynthesis protein RffC [Klebsiella michiganensis]